LNSIKKKFEIKIFNFKHNMVDDISARPLQCTKLRQINILAERCLNFSFSSVLCLNEFNYISVPVDQVLFKIKNT
jgi:hypothetical protein